MKDELNLILENLEESIMIVSVDDYKADFINHRFLSSFGKSIIDHVPLKKIGQDKKEEFHSSLTRFK